MASKKDKQQRSDYLVTSATDRIVLNEEESKRFVEALLNPPAEPTARFVKALAEYRANVTER